MQQPLTLSMANAPVIGEALVLNLTYRLITRGAKTKVIMALTGENEKKIRAIHKRLSNGEDLKRGPCQLPEAKFFVGVLGKKNRNANLHSTRFLACYLELKASFAQEMHPAFLFIEAFQCYEEDLRTHRMPLGEGQLDVNRAYQLLRLYESKEIVLTQCSTCESQHIKLNWFESADEPCPICAKAAHRRRLSEVGKQGGRRRLNQA